MSFSFIFLLVAAIFCCSCMAVDPVRNCSIAECVNSGNRDRSSAIVCNDCMSRILTYSDADTLLREVKEKGIGGHNLKMFPDLNADVLSVIFDELEIVDMVNLFNVYPDRKFWSVAFGTFSRRFKNYEMRTDMKYGPEGIEAYTARFLKLFGGAIKKIKIDNPTNLAIQNINKYARNSLTRLEIRGIEEEQFEYFKQPFGELTELHFSSNAEMKAGNSTLCELFPQLMRLSIWFNAGIEKSLMDCHFPHLEHFEVFERNLRIMNIGKDGFFSLIVKNPQIRSIQMGTLSQDFYNVLNEHVPLLENLTCSNIDVENDVSFEHVKHLYVHPSCDQIDKLSFPRLESIEIGFIDKNPEPWARFLEKHQNVSRLNVHGAKGYGIGYQLKLLASQLPNLVELKCSNAQNSIRGETISDIIDKSSKIMRIIITPLYVAEKHLNRLREQYGNDWDIIKNNSTKTILFEKKI